MVETDLLARKFMRGQCVFFTINNLLHAKNVTGSIRSQPVIKIMAHQIDDFGETLQKLQWSRNV